MMGLTADQATRMTPILLAGVILTGGFALVVHLAPRGDVTLPDFVPQPVSDGSGSQISGPAWESSDWLALSDPMRVLNHLSDDVPEPGDESEIPPDETEQTNRGANGTGPEVIQTGDFQFIGVIASSDRSVALISLNGKQRFVGPDDEIGNHTVVSVHPDHIIVRIDGVEKRMNLTEKARSTLNSADRYLQDRQRLIDQQRLNRERSRNNSGIPSPDSGDGR